MKKLLRSSAVAGRPTSEHRRQEAQRSAKTPTGTWLNTPFADTVAAEVIDTPSGQFGYLRLWSFSVLDVAGYVNEVARLLHQLPATGLIVDLRAIRARRCGPPSGLLQFVTPRSISRPPPWPTP